MILPGRVSKGLSSGERATNRACRPPTWSVLLEALEKGAEKREYAKILREDLIVSSKISQSKLDQ